MAAIDQNVGLSAEVGQGGVLTLTLRGRLDSDSTGSVWRKAMQYVDKNLPRIVRIEASAVNYLDGSGIGLLLALKQRQERQGSGYEFEITGLSDEFRVLLRTYEPKSDIHKLEELHEGMGFIEQLGHAAAKQIRDILGLVSFSGELTIALLRATVRPHEVRWKDALRVAESVGVDAVFIIALVGFLMGLIMAFQSAIPMRDFGAEIFVANLVALSTFRELGPLLTAIILAGRSGSAFAAELGTMKVNEEIDALVTMGLNPVRFLITPRIIAAVVMMPILTVFFNLFALMGAAVVMLQLGFPLITYYNQVVGAVGVNDFVGGLFKAFVFGILVAGIGCLRGLQTTTGAVAVGVSATRAVVSGIVLIALADGIFSVVYYFLGI